MKKLICFIFCMFALTANFYVRPVYAQSEWAQVTHKGVYIYKTPVVNSNVKNIICVAENTYYVEIISNYNEILYKVDYNGISGWVEKDKVKKVKGVPENPYPNDIKLTTYEKNCYLRSTPTKEDNVLSVVPSNFNGLKFIGMTYGEQIGDFDDNIWYYVEYLGLTGYVYNAYISSINTIFPNTEKLTFTNDDFEDVVNPLSDGTTVIVIVALSLPTFIIIYLLYKTPKTKRLNKRKHEINDGSVVEISELDERL